MQRRKLPAPDRTEGHPTQRRKDVPLEHASIRGDGSRLAVHFHVHVHEEFGESRHWPKKRINIRADSGFCRESIMRWCEEQRRVSLSATASLREFRRAVRPQYRERFAQPHHRQRVTSAIGA